MKKQLTIFSIYLVSIACFASWSYNWSIRTDQSGKPAGIFATTPFPIWETNTSYTITNDESPNGKTFQLGTLYFLDGAATNEGAGTWISPFQTILYAVANTPRGNNTLIVRGAHDGFGGYYTNTANDHISLPEGIDDTHRWMLVGYGQERPFLCKSTNSSHDTIGQCHEQYAYNTVQRFGFTGNNLRGAMFFGGIANTWDWYVNVIDCYFTNLITTITTSGNCMVYFSGNTQYGWMYHCTGRRTFEHGFKIGDGASNMLIEWCDVSECGFWPTIAEDTGITNWAQQIGQPSACIDFPNDAGVVSQNNTLRYSIASYGLAQGIQIRNCSNFVCYANEIHHCPNLTGNATLTNAATIAYLPQAQLWIGGLPGPGPTKVDKVYVFNNIIHDNNDTNAESSGIGLQPNFNANSIVSIYNNLIYNSAVSAIRFHPVYYPFTNRMVSIYNNTIYHNGSDTAIYIPNSGNAKFLSGEFKMFNNIVANTGTNSCVYINPELNVNLDYDYNLFYYPGGSRGTTLAANDIDNANPLFTVGGLSLQSGSPAINTGTNLSAYFTTDITGRTRGAQWDIGAYEYYPVAPPQRYRWKAAGMP